MCYQVRVNSWWPHGWTFFRIFCVQLGLSDLPTMDLLCDHHPFCCWLSSSSLPLHLSQCCGLLKRASCSRYDSLSLLFLTQVRTLNWFVLWSICLLSWTTRISSLQPGLNNLPDLVKPKCPTDKFWYPWAASSWWVAGSIFLQHKHWGDPGPHAEVLRRSWPKTGSQHYHLGHLSCLVLVKILVDARKFWLSKGLKKNCSFCAWRLRCPHHHHWHKCNHKMMMIKCSFIIDSKWGNQSFLSVPAAGPVWLT